MSDQPNLFSNHALIALDLAIAAARKGTTKIVISNQTLKRYFFGNERGRRLSKQQISDWAQTLKPILPRHKVMPSKYGPYLQLFLNETDDPLVQTKALQLPILDRATILKRFGVK